MIHEIVCLSVYLFTVLLAFWTCFKWHMPPISDGNTPLSSVKYAGKINVKYAGKINAKLKIIAFLLVWPVLTSSLSYVALSERRTIVWKSKKCPFICWAYSVKELCGIFFISDSLNV